MVRPGSELCKKEKNCRDLFTSALLYLSDLRPTHPHYRQLKPVRHIVLPNQAVQCVLYTSSEDSCHLIG